MSGSRRITLPRNERKTLAGEVEKEPHEEHYYQHLPIYKPGN